MDDFGTTLPQWAWQAFALVLLICRFGIPAALVVAGLWRRNSALVCCGLWLVAMFLATGGLS